jgi:hypothetical protein
MPPWEWGCANRRLRPAVRRQWLPGAGCDNSRVEYGVHRRHSCERCAPRAAVIDDRGHVHFQGLGNLAPACSLRPQRLRLSAPKDALRKAHSPGRCQRQAWQYPEVNRTASAAGRLSNACQCYRLTCAMKGTDSPQARGATAPGQAGEERSKIETNLWKPEKGAVYENRHLNPGNRAGGAILRRRTASGDP